MMNRCEKSDPATIATKPTNKADQSSAESVEVEAKGSADQKRSRKRYNIARSHPIDRQHDQDCAIRASRSRFVSANIPFTVDHAGRERSDSCSYVRRGCGQARVRSLSDAA